MAEVSGLMDTLKGPGQFTLFAPTNAAFDKIEGDVMERLMSDKTILQGKAAHRCLVTWSSNNTVCAIYYLLKPLQRDTLYCLLVTVVYFPVSREQHH